MCCAGRRRDRDADRAAELLRRVQQPGREPGFTLLDAARPAIDTGMNEKAVPSPARKNGPDRVAQKWPSTGACATQSSAPPIAAMPAASTSFAEPRVTSACDRYR